MLLQTRLATALLVSLAFCGCESDNPASDAATSQADERLLGGYWYDADDGDGNDGATQFDFIEGRPGCYRAVDWDTDGIIESELDSECCTTRIGDRLFISGRLIDAKGESDGWSIFEYRYTSADQFEVRSIDTDRLADAIAAGRVPGTVRKFGRPFGGMSCDPRLTASTEELRAFLAREGDAVFSREPDAVYVRKADPPAQAPPKRPQEIKPRNVIAAIAIVALYVVLATLND